MRLKAPRRQAACGAAALRRDRGDLTYILLGLVNDCDAAATGRPLNEPAPPMFILSSKFEKSFWPRLAAPLLAGILISGAYQTHAQAAPATYVVTDQDGYGVMECLTQKSDCGKIVADAWCESHGHGSARAYGRAEDITASIAAEPPRQPSHPDAAVVSCSN